MVYDVKSEKEGLGRPCPTAQQMPAEQLVEPDAVHLALSQVLY